MFVFGVVFQYMCGEQSSTSTRKHMGIVRSQIVGVQDLKSLLWWFQVVSAFAIDPPSVFSPEVLENSLRCFSKSVDACGHWICPWQAF